MLFMQYLLVPYKDSKDVMQMCDGLTMLQQEVAPRKPVRCEITPSSVRRSAGGGARPSMPHFQLYAELDSTVCPLDQPLTGKVEISEGLLRPSCPNLQGMGNWNQANRHERLKSHVKASAS